jgi:hypothetical protein
MIDDHAPPDNDPETSSDAILNPRFEVVEASGQDGGDDEGDHGKIEHDRSTSDQANDAESVRCRPRESNPRQSKPKENCDPRQALKDDPSPFPSPGTTAFQHPEILAKSTHCGSGQRVCYGELLQDVTARSSISVRKHGRNRVHGCRSGYRRKCDRSISAKRSRMIAS